MSLLQHPTFFSAYLDDFENINQALSKGYMDHLNDESIKRSHFFEGRYENIYITQETVKEISIILGAAIEHTANILTTPKDSLKAGLWFNAMEPGNITLAHRHDDDDELLSGAYYIAVPENSGELILSHKNFATHVTPTEGMFVFFPPDIKHEVSRNDSDKTRLSLGINIGPK